MHYHTTCIICCCQSFAIFMELSWRPGHYFFLFAVLIHLFSAFEVNYFVFFNIALRHETILSLLKCIEALVQCFSKRKVALDCCVVSAINPILKQIWTSTLRVVGIKHLTDSGFSLLTTLLQVTTLLFKVYLDRSSWFESFLAR